MYIVWFTLRNRRERNVVVNRACEWLALSPYTPPTVKYTYVLEILELLVILDASCLTYLLRI